MGGESTPAIGFSIGLERLVQLLIATNNIPALDTRPHIYFISTGENTKTESLLLIEKLHTALPSLRILLHCGDSRLKIQFKKADKSGALLACVLAEQELQTRQITIKYLRENKPQERIAFTDLARYLQLYFNNTAQNSGG